MFQNKNLSVLGSNLLFKGIDESLIHSIFNSKNFRAEKEGELIFQAGEESNYLYLILQGEVKLKYAGSKGSTSSFRRVKNEFFGEQETLEKIPRISSAVADTDCIFYLISKEELFSLINKERKILKNLTFTPDDEDVELPEEEQISDNTDEQNIQQHEKQVEEIVIDEDLADYSYESPSIEELRDFNEENYISYSDSDENQDDLVFNNNGFHPEENNLTPEEEEKILADILKNEWNDTLPDLSDIPENGKQQTEADDFIPPVDDLENLPEEPQKFAFESEELVLPGENPYSEERQPETETLSLVESVSKFVKANISFPLNEIKKLAVILCKSSKLPEAESVNELINKHIDSVSAIINTSFNFVSQKETTGLKKQSIKNVLNNILNLLSEYVETRKTHLYKKIETEAFAEVNETELYNVFLQLAKNACDSMPEGGNIFVTAVNEGDNIKIEFIDEGIGIPSSLAFDIFEPMVTHGKADGAGLGLSIAKKIITEHNGTISIDGELGEGTRIIISLPACN